NVTIKNIPECTCPDYVTRHQRCKHIYFILIKVMKCYDVDQDIFTMAELDEMFLNIPKITNNLVIDDKIKNTYEKLKHKKTLNEQNDDNITLKDTDDLCPICLDELEHGDELDYYK